MRIIWASKFNFIVYCVSSGQRTEKISGGRTGCKGWEDGMWSASNVPRTRRRKWDDESATKRLDQHYLRFWSLALDSWFFHYHRKCTIQIDCIVIHQGVIPRTNQTFSHCHGFLLLINLLIYIYFDRRPLSYSIKITKYNNIIS